MLKINVPNIFGLTLKFKCVAALILALILLLMLCALFLRKQ